MLAQIGGKCNKLAVIALCTDNRDRNTQTAINIIVYRVHELVSIKIDGSHVLSTETEEEGSL